MITRNTALRVAVPSDLVLGDSRVEALAKRFRWKPGTMLARIKSALPAPVEQQLYLGICRTIKMHPESMAKLLREIVGVRELSAHDLVSVQVGKNLQTSRFVEAMAILQEALWLIVVIARNHPGVSVSMLSVARLARAYGPDHVEEVVDSIVASASSFEELAPRRSFERLASIAIRFFTHDVLPAYEGRGLPLPTSALEVLEHNATLRNVLKRKIRGGGNDDE